MTTRQRDPPSVDDACGRNSVFSRRHDFSNLSIKTPLSARSFTRRVWTVRWLYLGGPLPGMVAGMKLETVFGPRAAHQLGRAPPRV